MTKRKNNSDLDLSSNYKKLSIQISLNGLSFSIVDTLDNTILLSDKVTFENELNPLEVENELSLLLEFHTIPAQKFIEVVAIHRNSLFCFVPKPLFVEEEINSYLKYNTKVLATDLVAFDEIENFDIINVFVPLTNINNYLYGIFGEFTYKHTSSIITSYLLNNDISKDINCYVYITEHQIDISIIHKKKLLLFNSYENATTEDIIYYLLFTSEQLKLDNDTLNIRLFGNIEEESAIFKRCYEHFTTVSIYVPDTTFLQLDNNNKENIDFTVINAL